MQWNLVQLHIYKWLYVYSFLPLTALVMLHSMIAKPQPQLPLTHAGWMLASVSCVTFSATFHLVLMTQYGKRMLVSVLAAAEVIPGMEPPPPPTDQKPLVQDSSGESFDDSPNSFNDASPESRRNSNKHASSSGSSGTTPSSPSSNGSSDSQQSPDGATQSKMSGNGSSNGGEVGGNGAKQQQKAGNGDRDSGGDGETSLDGGLGAEQAKQAVSVAGNKMQQAAQEEGVSVASRSVLPIWHC